MGCQAGRKKPDKWKNMLAAAEAENESLTAQVQALLQTQEVLARKQEVVNQIVDCYTAMAALTAQYGACTQPDWQLLAQQLKTCLQQLGGPRQCVALQPHALDYPRAVFNPDNKDRVKAMSDEDVLRCLRYAMGRCAIMVLQDQGAAAWEQHQHPASSCNSEPQQPSPQPQQEAGRRCGHLLINQGLSTAQRGPLMSPIQPVPAAVGGSGGLGQAANGGSDSIRTAADSTPASTCSSGGSQWCVGARGPAFEISVLWGTLFNHDNDRFMRLVSLDLETGQPLQLRHGPGFGKWLADRLRLTGAQIGVLKGLRDMVRQPHEQLPAAIQQTAVQQQLLTQRQQTQPQWSSNMRSAEQVHEAHAQALQQQAAALERFRILAKFMGLVTLNTLTPGQLAVLNACSWPAICRIEPVLDVLDELQLAAQPVAC